MPIRLLSIEGFRFKKFLKDKTIMAKLKITQVKSSIGSTKRQKLTLAALGLKKLNTPIVHEATPQIVGMVNKMRHLISVEEVK
jgi:large subunit ribosomal protein L30